MKVGIDAHMIGRRETGNETYAIGLLDGLESIGFLVDYYGFDALPDSRHTFHPIRPHLSLVRIPISTPIASYRDKLDLFHATYVLPPYLPCGGVVTVHDISFALYPHWFSPRTRFMLSTLVPPSMTRARTIITISESTKQDIISRYRVPPSKVFVTHLAPRRSVRPPRRIPSTTDPFFVYVGNVTPRKNLRVVIRAMQELRSRGIDVSLKVVGNPPPSQDDSRQLVAELGLESSVHFSGYVENRKVAALYATAIALVHPALYEGFGLTPLEAMAAGTPVISSNTSSLPEVVGDAAITLSPTDSEAWADAMERVYTDHSLAQDLSVRGRARAKEFSWERCARETVQVYSHALPGRQGIY